MKNRAPTSRRRVPGVRKGVAVGENWVMIGVGYNWQWEQRSTTHGLPNLLAKELHVLEADHGKVRGGGGGGG